MNEKLNASLSGHEPERTRFTIGLFESSQALKQATSALDRRLFVEKDQVQIIDQSKISPKNATNGQTRHLPDILAELGFSAQKAGLYADKIKKGYSLLVVRTDVERAEEVANIMHQAKAEEVT